MYKIYFNNGDIIKIENKPEFMFDGRWVKVVVAEKDVRAMMIPITSIRKVEEMYEKILP